LEARKEFDHASTAAVRPPGSAASSPDDEAEALVAAALEELNEVVYKDKPSHTKRIADFAKFYNSKLRPGVPDAFARDSADKVFAELTLFYRQQTKYSPRGRADLYTSLLKHYKEDSMTPAFRTRVEQAVKTYREQHNQARKKGKVGIVA
jgi:hypothetical protein